MRWTTRIGLLCLSAAFILPTGWGWWVDSRSWSPLEVPISLTAGHIKREFTINLNSTYEVQILLDEQADSPTTSCLFGTAYGDCSKKPSLRAAWTLYSEGGIAAAGDTNTARRIFPLGEGIGTFKGQRWKRYSIDLEILTDASSVNIANPRLRIQEVAGLERKYGSLLELFFISSPLLFGEGVILLVMTGVLRKSEAQDRNKIALTIVGLHKNELYLGLSDERQLAVSRSRSQYFTWAQTLPLKAPISGLPSFGLVFALFLSWLIFLFMILYQIRYQPQGVAVFLRKPAPSGSSVEHEDKPLLVHVCGGANSELKVYINLKLVAWDQLDNELHTNLDHRSVRAVYIDAAPDLSWQDVVKVIDIAHSVGARPVLLTSQTE